MALENVTRIHSGAISKGNWITMESERIYDSEMLICNSIMLLICVWFLCNKDRRVAAIPSTLLVAGVSLSTGLRHTKPVCSSGELLT